MEHIYNIFIFFENDFCSKVGYKSHIHLGNDKEGIDFLNSRISSDLAESKNIFISKPFSLAEYNAKCRTSSAHHLYDEVFLDANDNNKTPLFITTPVKNGVLFFNYISNHGQININDAWKSLGEDGIMDDWILKYRSGTEIDLPRLINDDYFTAIKMTFNAGLYVSSMKLLLSCIDSISYIEYGNARGTFVKWLKNYAKLERLAISAEELWELRNGILHMTNLNSEKVQKNKIRRISFKVSSHKKENIYKTGDIHYFNFHELIHIFADALESWLKTYNADRKKFDKFLERYDETISDSRYAIMQKCGE